MNISIGSLFSGIGGLELGLERGLADMGIEAATVWQAEVDPYAAGILARHWPGAQRFGSVAEVGAGSVAVRPDIIAGGFPCQDVSLAGRGDGLAGSRSGLWSEFERIVRELRPEWVVVENTVGLLSTGAGPGGAGAAMGAVVGGLAAVGYCVWWDCVPAYAVGADHRRDRVFIVARYADADGGRFEGEREPRYGGKPGSWRGESDRLGEGGARGWTGGQAGRTPEPGLGRARDGVSAGLDVSRGARASIAAHPWPGRASLSRQAEWERGLPRLTVDRKHRRNRLRCLGNAVVPHVARIIGQWIGFAIVTQGDEG